MCISRVLIIYNNEGDIGGSEHRNKQKILPNTASPKEKSMEHRHHNMQF